MACVDPYEVKVPEGEQLLTVEGIISTGPGPHAITLTRSATYGSIFEGLIRPVSLATVVVRDNEGNVTFLTEGTEAKGTYFTPANFRAEVGKSYTLQILTAEGNVYTSTPEPVAAAPNIQSLEVRTVTIPVEGSTFPKSGVQLIVELKDPADQNNFYYWRNGPAVYILETSPELYTPRPSPQNPNRTPQPKDCCSICFRYEAGNNQSLFVVMTTTSTDLAPEFLLLSFKTMVSDLSISLEWTSSSTAYPKRPTDFFAWSSNKLKSVDPFLTRLLLPSEEI